MHNRCLSVGRIRRRIPVDLPRVPGGLPPVRGHPGFDRDVRLIHAVVRPAVDGDGRFAAWRFGRVHVARSLKCARDLDAEVAQYRRARLLRVVVEEDVVAVSPQPRLAANKVWDFIRSQPGLWTDGHNIFLYHHPKQPGAPILCDFGVEVTRTFETAGDVYATETPGGEAAVAVHRGPYNRMNEAHDAIGKWIAANRRESAGHSWEIYGDPTPDPADTETTVVYLLK